MYKRYALLPLLPLILFACARPEPRFKTGMQVLYRYDTTRLFDTTAPNTPQYYRPVKIDLFYPSDLPGKALTYGDIMDMYEKRFNFDAPADSCKKMSQVITGMFAAYLHMDSAGKILSYPLQSTYNARPMRGKYGLIIYAAGMNGSTWENPLLFERLAAEGFVVAAISSVGKYPGFMTDAVDLEEQVKDILFAKKLLADSLPFIDTNNTGLLSWSMGGSAIVKAAMLAPDIKCLLSFDGTETHYYGFDTAWDRQFDQLLQLPPYSPEKLNIPYLYLSSGRSNEYDSVYFFSSHIPAKDKYYLRLANAIHEDFSSLPTIMKQQQPSLKNVHAENYDTICKLTSLFFRQYLKGIDRINTSGYIQQLAKADTAQFSTRYPTRVP